MSKKINIQHYQKDKRNLSEGVEKWLRTLFKKKKKWGNVKMISLKVCSIKAVKSWQNERLFERDKLKQFTETLPNCSILCTRMDREVRRQPGNGLWKKK